MIEKAKFEYKPEKCDHPDYIWDKYRGHICRMCGLDWSRTGHLWDSNDYIFDRLLGK